MDEALDAYKKEFKEFSEWLKPIVEYLKKTHGTVDAMRHMSSSDWKKYQSWAGEIQVMEKVLGLTKEEVKKIEDEIGFTAVANT